MNTLEQSPVELPPNSSEPNSSASNSSELLMSEVDATDSSETADGLPLLQHKITGFDGGTRPVFKEPSLYLSLIVIFIVSLVCQNNSPGLFWLSFGSMTALAVILHVLAERLIFRSNKAYDAFSAPFEGVFVVTLGSLLPFAGLLAYGVYSFSTAQNPNVGEEMAKLALLLVVPMFNFIVWSSVRKGYLIRPRLSGLMNGLALGLSASWTAIWIKSIFAHGDVSCKFGWMLLLCLSPFLLFAALCLSLDLWRKTEPSIARITTTFSVLGCLLSFVFVFAPMARGFYVQSLLTDARNANSAEQSKLISTLHSLITDSDLRPSKYPVSGFALASLLIPNRGLDAGTEADKALYFKITGKSFAESDDKSSTNLNSEANPMIGANIPGLSLAKSQLSGNIDSATLSGSVDWAMTFHNLTASTQEVRGEISLPKHAAVSRVTLWVKGEAREGAFAPTAKTQDAYHSVVDRQRDPLLVTMPTPDRLLFQCFPVPANGGDMKIRIGFKVPLETTDGKLCSLEFPKLRQSNFAQPKRHRINLVSSDTPLQKIGLVTVKVGNHYSINGILKDADTNTKLNSVIVLRDTAFQSIAVLDSFSKTPQYIVERLKEVIKLAPKHLYVVIDSSASLKSNVTEIKQVLASVAAVIKPIVYFASEGDKDGAKKISASAMTFEQAQIALTADAFVGGQDNGPVLQEVLETAAEKQNGAVLWIHGAQPMTVNLSELTTLDLIHAVRLYDMQLESGPNDLLRALQFADASHLIGCEKLSHDASVNDIAATISNWTKSTKSLVIERTLSKVKPQTGISNDKVACAQVTSLWANEETSRLLAVGQEQEAARLASNYRLVSPVTGAVVLDSAKEYKAHKLKPGAYKAAPGGGPSYTPAVVPSATQATSFGGGGLIGASVDPRYGQSNEVGAMADFGYDAARDICNLVVGISLLLSILLGTQYLRTRKTVTQGAVIKAVALILMVPTIVRVLGTFVINNYGGLGGGL